MADCEHRDSCNFFNEQVSEFPHIQEYIKSLYCNEASFTECAIYLISKIYGKDHVPKNLYPNDVHKLLHFNLLNSV